MKVRKTLKIPVAEEITRGKLCILDRLMARLTYGVQLYLEKIVEENVVSRARAESFRKEIQAKTGLSSAFAQACRDTALWMYRSYLRLHVEWERRVERLRKKLEVKDSKKLKKKLEKLLAREPQPPGVKDKIPVMIDRRMGEIKVEFSRSAKEFKLWLTISTLKRGQRVDIPLHSYPYAEKHLREWEVKSFQIVWNLELKRYEVHVVVEKEVSIKPRSVAGIDLDMRMLIAVHEVGEEGSRALLLHREEFACFFARMRELNNRIARLQRLGKLEVLRKLRRKRKNLARDFRRKLVNLVANSYSGALVFIGLPEHIREEHFRGNQRRRLRKRVHQWAFRELAEMLRLKLLEAGNIAVIISENGTTALCSACGSRKVKVDGINFACQDCGHTEDRDINAARNIMWRGLNQVLRKGAGAAVNLPELPMRWLEKPPKAEAHRF
jgi:putative transposase